MAYLSLNRRWRPRSFGDVTHQEHVTRTLRNAIVHGRLAQAYLFGGRRGTGKTTMARLLAMSLNCQAPGVEGPTAEPCGKCESCQAIAGGTSPDVIELDAASNRGIDEIRALQENVRLLPMSGRYKVYIIDEAHQMTKDAYNAFLKTLEEPPPHVIFILATTEPERILPTVRSRCQRFDFRPVPEQDIVKRLRVVAEGEKIEATDDLLRMVARKAEGSLRDALGLLEQCVAFAGDKPTVQDFLTVAGGVDRDALRRLVTHVTGGRGANVIAELDAMFKAGRDPAAVASGLVGYLRDVFLAGLGSESTPSGEDPPDPELVADARTWSGPTLVRCIDALIKADSEMRYSPQPRLVLEMALLSLALGSSQAAGEAPVAGSGGQGTRALGTGAGPVSERPAGAHSETGADPVSSPATGSEPEPARGAQGAPGGAEVARRGFGSGGSAGLGAPDQVDLQWFRDNWEDLLSCVRKRSVFARAFLLKATPVGYEDGVVTLGFDAKFHKEQMEVDKNRRACEEALSEAAGVKLMVRCRLLGNGGNGGENGTTEPSPPPEEPLVPRAEPVKLPPPARPGGSGVQKKSGYGSRSGSGWAPGTGSRPGPQAGQARLPAGPLTAPPTIAPWPTATGPAATGPATPGPPPPTPPDGDPGDGQPESVRHALNIFSGTVVNGSKPGDGFPDGQ